MSGRRVLVTGGSGFLGASLCRRLMEDGAVVHATSREVRPGPPEWSQPDLGVASEVQALFEQVRPEIVYHFAGHVTAAPDRELVLPTFGSLVTSTIHVLMSAANLGCDRVVLAGSLTEPMAPGETPGSPYAAAKFACNGYAKMFHALYGLSVVVTRPFMVYGPGQNPEKVIPYAAAALLRGEVPKLSSGQSESDWIYIDDVVEGLVRAGVSGELGGREVDLGTGSVMSLRSVIEKLAETIGGLVRPEFGGRADRPLERARAANVDEAARRLEGWRSLVGLDEGLRRTVAALSDPLAKG